MTPKRGEGRARITLRLLGRRLERIGIPFAVVFVAVALALYFLERDLPDTHFGRLSDAFWFCIVTMSTVGYGDVFPITGTGRIIAGGFILFTLGTVGLLITAISEAVSEVRRMEENGLISTRMKGTSSSAVSTRWRAPRWWSACASRIRNQCVSDPKACSSRTRRLRASDPNSLAEARGPRPSFDRSWDNESAPSHSRHWHGPRYALPRRA